MNVRMSKIKNLYKTLMVVKSEKSKFIVSTIYFYKFI